MIPLPLLLSNLRGNERLDRQKGKQNKLNTKLDLDQNRRDLEAEPRKLTSVALSAKAESIKNLENPKVEAFINTRFFVKNRVQSPQNAPGE